MSHSVDEYYSVYNERRVCARKDHKCDACHEKIEKGHDYYRVGIVFDKRGHSVNRCLRCQTIHVHLRQKAPYEMWPDERLDCGEEYYDHWGHEPPPEIAALAFALPGEIK